MNTSEGASGDRTKKYNKKEKTEGFNLSFLKSNMLFRAEALLF